MTRLINRNRGGANNAKGNAFEAEFAIHTAARLFNEGETQKQTVIFSQTQDLVDDLVCVNQTLSFRDNYQLKNSPSIRWSSGIADDFKVQQDVNLNHYRAANSKTVLVISDEDCHRKLNKKLPKNIKSHSTCVHFKAENFNALLAANDPQVQPFKDLCAFPNDSDKVTVVWAALNGAWCKHQQQGATADQIIKDAATGYEPGYFKLRPDAQISRKLQELLDMIDGLSYSVEHGYLEYVVKGCVSGRIDVDSEDLKQLEDKLTEKPITNWSQFLEATGRS